MTEQVKLDLAGIRARAEKLKRIAETSARFPDSAVAQDALYAATEALALVNEVERLTQEVERQKSVLNFGDRILRFHKEGAAKLRARVAELEAKHGVD